MDAGACAALVAGEVALAAAPQTDSRGSTGTCFNGDDLVFALTWRQSVRRQYQADTERLIEERTAALARTTVIVENSPVVLVRWLPGDGWPVEYVSDNIAQFDYSPAEFQTGRLKWSDILIPADLERMRQEVARDRDVGLRRTRQEYRIVTADGRVRWMEDRTSIVEGRGGRLIHQGIISSRRRTWGRTPGSAVLYCSGYSRQALTDSAVPDEESLELLLEPYAPRVLLERVRAVLAARARAGGASSAGPTS